MMKSHFRPHSLLKKFFLYTLKPVYFFFKRHWKEKQNKKNGIKISVETSGKLGHCILPPLSIPITDQIVMLGRAKLRLAWSTTR